MILIIHENHTFCDELLDHIVENTELPAFAARDIEGAKKIIERHSIALLVTEILEMDGLPFRSFCPLANVHPFPGVILIHPDLNGLETLTMGSDALIDKQTWPKTLPKLILELLAASLDR